MNRLGNSAALRYTCLQGSARVAATLRACGVLSSGQRLEDYMQKTKMAGPDETVFDVFSRSTRWLAKAGEKFYGPSQVSFFHNLFLTHVSNFELILGSPMLTNAGRREGKSVSACSIPPVSFSKMSREQIAKMVGEYHSRGMGTGFSLDELADPVSMVFYLNEIAIREVQQGKIERSCGNMGVLSIDHPKVLDFIRLKTANPEIREWKFNISVNLTDAFIHAWTNKLPFYSIDGTRVDPEVLMRYVAESAHASGDPGIIFMDRINQHNRVPQAGQYKTVVPCGETSLFDGEVCQFGYVNLARFVANGEVNREGLKDAVHTMVVLLDNAVEANIASMPNEQSACLISSLRRIGVGVCGFAEVLQALGLPYDSQQGRDLAANIMSLINFESKRASILLAADRGPFPLFNALGTKKELFISPFKAHPTSFVTEDDWDDLERQFNALSIRNLATTILPPSGRSSLLAGVTASIEPPFKLVADGAFEKALEMSGAKYGYTACLKEVLEHVKATGSVQETDLPVRVKEVFKCALEIAPRDHILMTGEFQKHTDEGISKTVNVPYSAKVQDVMEIYRACYDVGLKGMTVYRDGSRTLQPKSLNTAKESMTIDTLYGPIRVSKKIAELLVSPELTRLKGIHQNGCAYLVDPRQSASRYDHSVGALALAQLLGADESQQIAALLHDISHTAFSHVIDLVFENKKQNFHDLKRQAFLSSSGFIEKFGLTEKELACETIPLVKGKRLNVDRLDYCIRDLLAVGRIGQPEYASIVHNLIVNKDGEIVCKDIDTARLIFTKLIEVNQEVYFDPQVEVASITLASIIKKMLQDGMLTESDLFETDAHIIQKIEASRFKEAFSSIGANMRYSTAKHSASMPTVLRKLRYVDPEIHGLEGTLTDHCATSRNRLAEYLKTDTKLYYYIPLLENHI